MPSLLSPILPLDELFWTIHTFRDRAYDERPRTHIDTIREHPLVVVVVSYPIDGVERRSPPLLIRRAPPSSP